MNAHSLIRTRKDGETGFGWADVERIESDSVHAEPEIATCAVNSEASERERAVPLKLVATLVHVRSRSLDLDPTSRNVLRYFKNYRKQTRTNAETKEREWNSSFPRN